MADWRTTASLTGSSGCFPSFPLTFEHLRSSTVYRWRTTLAQKLLLEQLWRRISFTSATRCSPDGGSKGVLEREGMPAWQVEEDAEAQLTATAEESGVS